MAVSRAAADGKGAGDTHAVIFPALTSDERYAATMPAPVAASVASTYVTAASGLLLESASTYSSCAAPSAGSFSTFLRSLGIRPHGLFSHARAGTAATRFRVFPADDVDLARRARHDVSSSSSSPADFFSEVFSSFSIVVVVAVAAASAAAFEDDDGGDELFLLLLSCDAEDPPPPEDGDDDVPPPADEEVAHTTLTGTREDATPKNGKDEEKDDDDDDDEEGRTTDGESWVT
mmetsp:Transcript_6385/g.16645  ORF Transcript_6385/g.16645 Transcript_6385/m.16645 type:complete len:233 (+) Transcript_6385:366-1064(+)